MEEEQQLSKERDIKGLKQFWRDLLPLLQASMEGSKLHDMARLEYQVNSEVVPTDPEDADKKVLL